MSRTDVHVPDRVKARDPGWRHHYRELHDHRTGPCDLAAFLAADRWVRTRCSVGPGVPGRNVFCGCDLCTGRVWRRVDRRRERAAVRRLLRTVRGGVELDVPARPVRPQS